ncbi:MAG: LysR family transcriptional regulator [Acidimicrobiales bacterium]
MELRQLQYLVAVAEEEHFTRAAERMHVAQPGISQQIRRLEQDLGAPLFDRSGRTVRLTEAGQAFLPHARAALAAADGGRAALAALRGLLRGRLSLGSIPGRPGMDLAGLLAGFHRRYPAVEVSLGEDQPDELLEDLRRGVLDAAIVGLSEPQAPAGITIEVVCIEAMVVVTSAGHPLSGRRRVRIEALEGQPFVTLTRGSAQHRAVEAACTSAGFRPWVAFETSDVNLLTSLVAEGLGVTIIPASVAEAIDPPSRVHTIRLTSPTMRRCTALAWRTAGPHSPAGQAFVDLARESLPVRNLVTRPAQ